jgi:hypothetical protein
MVCGARVSFVRQIVAGFGVVPVGGQLPARTRARSQLPISAAKVAMRLPPGDVSVGLMARRLTAARPVSSTAPEVS